MCTRAGIACAALLLGVVPRAVVAQVAPATARAAVAMPTRLTDEEFKKFMVEMSEPGGIFASENLVSNETGFQVVIPPLLRTPRAGKVYLGVGPEQNFTYIAAIKPQMAIIFDIRRGNLLLQLMYKALFELSTDRADFVSKLFSKPRPARLDTATTVDSIMNSYWTVFGDTVLYRRNRDAITEVLTKKHDFGLTAEDMSHLFWIYDQFYTWGLPLQYTSNRGGFGGGGGMSNMPSYYDVMTANDGTGMRRSYLASEANWRFMKDLHARNMLVPVVGNFGGPTAIRNVGAWLKERGGVVTAFYASNVEQYLFQDGIAWNYYGNVAELPIDSTSVIIRSQGGGRGGGGGGAGGMRGPNRLCSIQDLLAANKEGRIRAYGDVFYYCQY